VEVKIGIFMRFRVRGGERRERYFTFGVSGGVGVLRERERERESQCSFGVLLGFHSVLATIKTLMIQLNAKY
jgi:hypothetical protein